MTNKLEVCGDINVSKASKKDVLVVSCNGALAGTGRTKCNAFVDYKNEIIHLFDDLKHDSTSIVSVVNNRFIVELTSLLGIEYTKFKIIIYYSPIKHTPFIVKFLKDKKEFVEAKKEDINDCFYKLALNNERIIH